METTPIPVPSAAQLRWQRYERTMFIHFNPTTWTGKEYDDLSLPLDRMNPSELDTDQWCETALSWGARMILFVAKHTGGFCWWQTATSEYGVRNIPWRGGKGDVLADLSASCRKSGLDLGVYVYPGDAKWGARIGSGGRTDDPSLQEAYNRVFRRQLVEVLTLYGPMREVWFDGSCVIDVRDILREHASDAVVFQGPMASIRWVGNEKGVAPYPNWYTLKREDLEKGVATALHSDPDGDVYAPVETDLPILCRGGHKWFWAEGTDRLLPDVDMLMDVYYKSVGRGSVMLLNSSPDTRGLIPESHRRIYRAFGEEIRRRFRVPLGAAAGNGPEVTIRFGQPAEVDHVVIREDIAHGQSVRSYSVEGLVGEGWETLCAGSSIGNRRIEAFAPRRLTAVRLTVTRSAAEARILDFSAYLVGAAVPGAAAAGPERLTIGTWDSATFGEAWHELRLDLTPHIDRIGQYEVEFQQVSYDWTMPCGLEFEDWRVSMYGRDLPGGVEKVPDAWIFRVTRSQQTERMDDFPTVLTVRVRGKPGRAMGNIELRRIAY